MANARQKSRASRPSSASTRTKTRGENTRKREPKSEPSMSAKSRSSTSALERADAALRSKPKEPSKKLRKQEEKGNKLIKEDKKRKRPRRPKTEEDQDEKARRKPRKSKRGSGKPTIADDIEAALRESNEGGDLDDAAVQALSKFRNDFNALREVMDPSQSENFRLDKAAGLFSRASLGMILDLIPHAEEAYRTTKKESAAYALVALLNQARELQGDVKVNDDTEGKIRAIQSIYSNAFSLMADALLRENHELISNISNEINKPAHVRIVRNGTKQMLLSLGKYVDELRKRTSLQMAAYIEGDPDYLNAGKKVEKED